MLGFYAYFLNVLGPITPYLRSEMHLSYTVGSLHFAAFAAGVLVTGLGGRPVIRRTGAWRALWLGAVGLGAGALALTLGRTPPITVASAFVMGAVGTLILVIVATGLDHRYQAGRAAPLAEANFVSSVLSTLAPLLVGLSVRLTGDWRIALLATTLTLAAVYGMFRHVAPQFEGVAATETSVSTARLSGLYWLYWLALTLSIAIEFCIISWSADYLETFAGLSKVNAAQSVSIFLAAMIAGRLTGSRLVQQRAPASLVNGALLLTTVGFLFFWQGGGRALILTGLFVAGLGVANLYPLILSQALAAARNNPVLASTRATSATGCAILALPLMLGRIADAVGIHTAYSVVLLLLALAFALVQAAALAARRGEFVSSGQ